MSEHDSNDNNEVEAELAARAWLHECGFNFDEVDNLKSFILVREAAAENKGREQGIKEGLLQRCPKVRRQCLEDAERRGWERGVEDSAKECEEIDAGGLRYIVNAIRAMLKRGSK